MLVKDLSWLVEIWRLVEKDPSTKQLYLSKYGAYIAGMHVAAVRNLLLPLDQEITVDGAMVVGTLGLLREDTEVALKQTESSLVIIAGRRRAVLRAMSAAPPPHSLDIGKHRFDGTKLRSEVKFLRACTSGGVVRPILTGIHFRRGTKKVIVEATDAERRSGRAAISLPEQVAGQVVPAGDLDAALSLLTTKIAMKLSGTRVVLGDRQTVVALSLLQGAYPDLSRLKKPQNYKFEIEIHRQHLELAIRAAILFDSDRVIKFVIENRRASFVVVGQETGGFRQPISGKIDLDDIEIAFDAHWLDAAQYIGDKITMRYNDSRSPVLFSGNGRLLWMSSLVRV